MKAFQKCFKDNNVANFIIFHQAGKHFHHWLFFHLISLSFLTVLKILFESQLCAVCLQPEVLEFTGPFLLLLTSMVLKWSI